MGKTTAETPGLDQVLLKIRARIERAGRPEFQDLLHIAEVMHAGLVPLAEVRRAYQIIWPQIRSSLERKPSEVSMAHAFETLALMQILYLLLSALRKRKEARELTSAEKEHALETASRLLEKHNARVTAEDIIGYMNDSC